MNIKAICVALILGTAPAHADITYDFNYVIGGLGGLAFMNGSITTNGDFGVLQPEDILSWEISQKMIRNGSFDYPVTVTYGSATDGLLIFTPTSLTATENNLFWDAMYKPGFGYTATLVFSDPPDPTLFGDSPCLPFAFCAIFGLQGGGTPLNGYAEVTARAVGHSSDGFGYGTQFFDVRFYSCWLTSDCRHPVQNFATVSQVPSPVIGTGLPGLVVMLSGLLVWRRWLPARVTSGAT